MPRLWNEDLQNRETQLTAYWVWGREMVSRLLPLIAVATTVAGCGAGADAQTKDAAAVGQPSVAAVRKSPATIWAVGDSAGGSNASSVARLVKNGKPDEVLYLGDIYEGDRGFSAYKRLYGSLPVARTPGNHDFPQYWSGREWYSFTAAGWRLIELNSETRQDPGQLSWLKSQLHARGTCRIAFWHRPRYTGGPHGDAFDMDQYWRALQRHATLVISGHDHDMQRFRPRGGLVQLVQGAGGEAHYPVNRDHTGLVWSDDTHWGATRITLTRGHARVAFVATSGQTLDSQTFTCHT